MNLAKCCSILFIVLYIMGSALAVSADYDVKISENGNSLVIINISGKDCFDLPLPLDVAEPNVTGALYVYSEKGVEVCIGSTESAIIVYRSALLTEKTGGWTFKMDLPALEKASAKINFPQNAIVTKTTPSAKIWQADGAKYAIYNIGNATSIEAKYKFGTAETPAAATTGFYFLAQNYGLYGILLLVVIAAALSYFFYFSKKLAKITPGQENVAKTLTENEAKVVKMLLENKGSIKRNQLERSSELAKSSLAAVLYNLENKNIVGVDKSNTVHHVKLSDWFKGL
ncbi:MAG: hypothetical protein HYW05_03790 [Candidatus Diapherotrites archaeon]|nr:hypothetical protein [Candidatus Diapherotrites archaeon]